MVTVRESFTARYVNPRPMNLHSDQLLYAIEELSNAARASGRRIG